MGPCSRSSAFAKQFSEKNWLARSGFARRYRLTLLLLTFAMLGTAGLSALAEPPKLIATGTLDCTIGPSIGLVVGARQHARCFYKSDHSADSRSYVGRLERVGRGAGLPSGGKLIWIVFAPDGPKNELSGRYVTLSDNSQFSEGDSYTVCRAASKVVCLRPARPDRDDAWKPNLASTVSLFRLETSPAHFSNRQRKKL